MASTHYSRSNLNVIVSARLKKLFSCLIAVLSVGGAVLSLGSPSTDPHASMCVIAVGALARTNEAPPPKDKWHWLLPSRRRKYYEQLRDYQARTKARGELKPLVEKLKDPDNPDYDAALLGISELCAGSLKNEPNIREVRELLAKLYVKRRNQPFWMKDNGKIRERIEKSLGSHLYRAIEFYEDIARQQALEKKRFGPKDLPPGLHPVAPGGEIQTLDQTTGPGEYSFARTTLEGFTLRRTVTKTPYGDYRVHLELQKGHEVITKSDLSFDMEDPGKGELNSTWVHPDFRRRGLGEKTLQNAISLPGLPFIKSLKMEYVKPNAAGNKSEYVLNYEIFENEFLAALTNGERFSQALTTAAKHSPTGRSLGKLGFSIDATGIEANFGAKQTGGHYVIDQAPGEYGRIAVLVFSRQPPP